VQFFEDEKEEIIEYLKEYIKTSRHNILLSKHRPSNILKAIVGEVPKDAVAIENGLKFRLNFYNQNIGYFGDTKNVRMYVESIAKGKKVLNLFSYTCGFSLYAKRGKANEIINMDMSKNAISIGMKNHSLNGFDMKNILFWPHNILKSFSKIKKNAPYDVIIIDPPTYQTNFIAKNDYLKIIKRLDSFSNPKTILIACLNSPEYDDKFLKDLVEKNSSFKCVEKIENPSEYKNGSLKSLVFSFD
jgi:23S rRNA (cytosine1962-C5)-methyltransferase